MNNLAITARAGSASWHTASMIDQTLPINEKVNQFEIHQFEAVSEDSFLFSDPSTRKSRFAIIWIKKGNGIMHLGRQLFPIQDNMIYCIAPGTDNNFFESEDPLEGYHISFSNDFIQSWQGTIGTGLTDYFEEAFHHRFIPIPENIRAELEIIAHKMKQEYENSFNQKLDLLKGLLNIFIIYFSRSIQQEGQSNKFTREHLLCKNFIRLVRSHFTSMKMVSDYANQLSITPNYLSRTVKKISGNTASYHIQQQIIIEAKKQAVYHGSSLKEIAYSLGFDNLAHFSKFFKSNNGTSFSCFKKGL